MQLEVAAGHKARKTDGDALKNDCQRRKDSRERELVAPLQLHGSEQKIEGAGAFGIGENALRSSAG